MLKDWRKNYAEMCFRWSISIFSCETIDSLDVCDLHQSQGVGDCVEQGGTGHGCPHNKVLAHFHEMFYYISVVFPENHIIHDGKAASFVRTLSWNQGPI